jgi:hypothetical protein
MNSAGINPSALPVAWFRENAIDWTRLYGRLIAFGLVPIGVVAAVTTVLLGPWQAAPGVAFGAAAAAWVRLGAPTWFIGEDTHADWDDAYLLPTPLLTTGEQARRHAITAATVIGIGLVNFTIVLCIVRVVIPMMTSNRFLQILGSGWMLLIAASGIQFVTYLVRGAANLADLLAQLVLEELAGVLGRLPASLLAAPIAGTAAGAAGALIVRIATVMAHTAFWEIDPEHFPKVLVGYAIGPLVGLAGGVVFAAQHAVSDVHTQRVVYQQRVRSGALPGDLRAFLAWADGRLILRKVGAEYQFVHHLYRIWWTRQGPPRPTSRG